MNFKNHYFLNNATEAGNDLIFEIPATGIECLKLIGEHILMHFMSFEYELRWAEVHIF